MSGPPIDPDAFRAAFAALQARVEFLEGYFKLFVPEAKLDGPRSNIKINFDPRNWRGQSHRGKRASECDPEFLDQYAEALMYFAEHPKPGDDAKKAGFNRLDAARCRTWARRHRAQAAKAEAEAEAAKANLDPFADEPAPSDHFIVGRESPDLFDDAEPVPDTTGMNDREAASAIEYVRSGQAGRDAQAWADDNAAPFDEPSPDPFDPDPLTGDP